jgi:hypothetical protein
MKKYVTLVEGLNTVKEPVESMTAKELATEMEKTVLKVFPKSYARASYQLNLGESISLTFALAKDKSELGNGIIHNDPAHTIFMIQDGLGRDNDIVGKLIIERILGSGFSVKPSEGSYMAMERHKVGFRKTTGDSKKILASLKKYFEKLKVELKANESNIYNYKLKGKF